MNRAKIIALSALAAISLSACGNSDVDETAVEPETTVAKGAPKAGTKPEPGFDGTVAKPGAPFSVSYKVIGTPIVGSPVTIDLLVTSALGPQPVTVSYRINDASAMMFHEAQPLAVEVSPAANEDFVKQQVTVIPQREGRLYLNVGASVETDSGSMSSMMAIPIQVGSGGRKLEEHGELQLDENGESVRVLTPE
ncbi:MAG: hypothetical protein OEM50_04600 [Gammaproteobacteria bacterium]|nr:hypothetical protein [Gammaproteobacteria bacterium]MDH3363729.1 hypothetical protein [Gammaproteobacteria bacterium]MDH3480973.1 hypothetical protein [Gammaproteobacteria bacterium]